LLLFFFFFFFFFFCCCCCKRRRRRRRCRRQSVSQYLTAYSPAPPPPLPYPTIRPQRAGGSDFILPPTITPSRVAEQQRPHFVVVHNPNHNSPRLDSDRVPTKPTDRWFNWYQRLGLVHPSVITVVSTVSFTRHYSSGSSS
jgi:hypothetical protein